VARADTPWVSHGSGEKIGLVGVGWHSGIVQRLIAGAAQYLGRVDVRIWIDGWSVRVVSLVCKMLFGSGVVNANLSKLCCFPRTLYIGARQIDFRRVCG
jgi:hypothetical protein